MQIVWIPQSDEQLSLLWFHNVSCIYFWITKIFTVLLMLSHITFEPFLKNTTNWVLFIKARELLPMKNFYYICICIHYSDKEWFIYFQLKSYCIKIYSKNTFYRYFRFWHHWKNLPIFAIFLGVQCQFVHLGSLVWVEQQLAHYVQLDTDVLRYL